MVNVVRLDPYDKVSGFLIPFVTQRMMDMAKEYVPDATPEGLVQSVMVPLWAREPSVLLLAFVTDKGQVVGHCVCTIGSDAKGEQPYVFIPQLKFDDNVGDARWQALQLVDEWGKAHGCKRMLMATPGKNEKPWARKYGFKVDRLVSGRDLGSHEGESE